MRTTIDAKELLAVLGNQYERLKHDLNRAEHSQERGKIASRMKENTNIRITIEKLINSEAWRANKLREGLVLLTEAEYAEEE